MRKLIYSSKMSLHFKSGELFHGQCAFTNV